MGFFKKRKAPHPTGSGDFIKNIRWWFWDDCTTPGLITGDAFSKLIDVALTDKEAGRLASFLVRDMVASERPHDAAAVREVQGLLAKLGAHLISIREGNPAAIDDWVKSKWTSTDTAGAKLDVLKAYLNVLQSWGYAFSWQNVKDARNIQSGMLVLADGRPTHFIVESDIREINGRPDEFSIWMNGIASADGRIGGGNWHFHYQTGAFDMVFVEHEQR